MTISLSLPVIHWGEQIVPQDVVEWKGQEFFEKLKTKAREDRMQAEIEKRKVMQAQAALPRQAAELSMGS